MFWVKQKSYLYFWVLLFMIVMILLPGHSTADEMPQSLSLTEALARALKGNPEIQAARHHLQAAGYQIDQARSGLLPQLNLSEAYNRTNSPLWAFGTKLNQEAITSADFAPDRLNDPDDIDNFKTALTLSWSLFNGGSLRIGLDQARQNQKATALALMRSEQQVMANTAKAYVGLLLARENQEVVDQALATAQAHLKLVQNRFKSGLSVKSDVLRAQVRIADLNQQLLDAGSQILVANAMLNAAMGSAMQTSWNLITPFERCTAPTNSLNQWINKTLEQRPELKQMKIQEEIASKEIKRARAAHWPTLTLQGNYEINSEDFNDTGDSYSLGAVVQVNLYSGNRISAQAAEAKATLQQVRQIRKGLELGVRVETQKAFYQSQSAWQRIEVARSAVSQAEEGLRIVANRYQNGLLTIVDLLDAQVALQQAQTGHFKALHDYKTARIDLSLATGTMNEKFR